MLNVIFEIQVDIYIYIYIYIFSVRNDLSFNSSKSYCMVFKPKSYKLSCPLLYMDSQVLKYADNVKYLSFTFRGLGVETDYIHFFQKMG